MNTMLIDALAKLQHFSDIGGNIAVVILLVMCFLWYLILERLYFNRFDYPILMQNIIHHWESRSEHESWCAKQTRTMLIAQAKSKLQENISTLKNLVVICPLLGLLGTVIGMIEVFTVLGNVGMNEPKLMAAGVSKATIPTMVGLVVALSGIYFSTRLSLQVEVKVRILSDKLRVPQKITHANIHVHGNNNP